MRDPTEAESRRWTEWRAKTENVVAKGQALVLLAKVGDKMQIKIEQLTGIKPEIVTEIDGGIVNEIGRRAKILNELITGVLLRNYYVRFVDLPDVGNQIQIVSMKEEVDPSDIYPEDEIQMGIAPIIVATAIAAVVLLIAGDQASDRLNQQIEIERTKLQSRMIEADKDIVTQPPDVRAQWDAWKKSSAKTMKEMAADNPVAKSWLEKLIGETGTSALIIGALAIGALAFWYRR